MPQKNNHVKLNDAGVAMGHTAKGRAGNKEYFSLKGSHIYFFMIL